MSIDEEPVDEKVLNKEVTLEEATENYYDFGVPYEIPPQREQRKNEEVKIVNHTLEDVVAEKIEVKEPVETPVKENLLEEKSKDLELTDDLFNLIDSMYKERND